MTDPRRIEETAQRTKAAGEATALRTRAAAVATARAVRQGSEYGRLLAERDRLVAAGVDPAELETPRPPTRSQGPRPPQWFLDEARRQGTPDPVVPYERLDLRVDHEPVRRSGHVHDASCAHWILPAVVGLAWVAAVLAIGLVIAMLTAPRPAALPSSPADVQPIGAPQAGPGGSGSSAPSAGSRPGQRPLGGGAPQTLNPRVGREGDIAHSGSRAPYVAIPLGPGIRIRVCGPADCITVTSTDAGPNRESLLAGRIMDLDITRWERVCGMPARFGLCPGSWVRVGASSPTLPPTDGAP